MPWTKSCFNYRWQTRRPSQIGTFAYWDTFKFWLLPFPTVSLPTVWLSWNETASMVGFLNDLKQKWTTLRPACTKRLILITFGLQGKWKRKTQWSYSEMHGTRQLITLLNQKPLVSSLCGSSKGTNQYLKQLLCAWVTWKRKVPKGMRKWKAKTLTVLIGLQKSSWCTLWGPWRMPMWRRSTVINAVAQSTLSTTACWWEPQERICSQTARRGWHQRREPGPLRWRWQCPRTPRRRSQGITQPTQTPFLNPDPFQCWHRVENVAKVKINGESCMTFLDNGTQINTITPKYACVGLRNAYTWPLGYVIVWVQVHGVQGYDEDKIALVVPDEVRFAEQIPVILGTPTISCILNVMKEREIDALVMPWANARVVHLLSVCRAAATVVDDKSAESANPNGYNEVVFMRNTETIDPFSSHVIPVKVENTYTGEYINVITQALQTEDGSLPQGLTVQNVYTELQNGSKNVGVVVRISTAYPQTLQKKAPVARAVATIMVLETLPETKVQEGEDQPQDPHPPNLTTRQRQGKLFGVYQMQLHALWAMQCDGHVSEADAKLSLQVKPHLLPHLLRWHNHILVDGRGTSL